MGFNRPTWLPGYEREAIAAAPAKRIARLREQREQRALEGAAAKALAGSLISLAALVGSEVTDPEDRVIGQLRDVVVRWTKRASYPPVTAVVVRMGKRDVLIGARWIEARPPASLRLRVSKAYVHAAERHPADVMLAHDVLDRQVLDADGVQIVRPADIYPISVADRIEVVGIEVGIRALLRRIGARRLRGRIRPQRVIDWASISSFAPAREDGDGSPGRRAGGVGQPGAGLKLGDGAGDVRRLQPSDVEAALRDAHIHARDGSS
jgi:hypothetical protein